MSSDRIKRMRRGLSVINISEVAVKIGTDIFAQILHLSQCLDVNIQTILHTVCCRKDFLFTMGIDAFLAVCLWRFAQFCQEIGQVLFDGFGISECSRINGNKTMHVPPLPFWILWLDVRPIERMEQKISQSMA